MLDLNLRLFSERLKRTLAVEEGMLTLADSINFDNTLTVTEIITNVLGNYEADMAWLLVQLCREEDADRQQSLGILKDINYFVHTSKKAIDSFFVSIMQHESEGITCKELSDALFGLRNKFVDIRNQMQQRPPRAIDIDINAGMEYLIHTSNSSCSEFNRTSELQMGRRESFDLLIERQPRLPVFAILDSSGFHKTAFATQAYKNNHVKFYFNCRALVRVSISYNFRKILDDACIFIG